MMIAMGVLRFAKAKSGTEARWSNLAAYDEYEVYESLLTRCLDGRFIPYGYALTELKEAR